MVELEGSHVVMRFLGLGLLLAMVLMPVSIAGADSPALLLLAEEEAEFLMNQGLPFAEKMLADHGEFFPFGSVLYADGSATTVSPQDDREQPPTTELLESLLDGIRSSAAAGTYKATAVFVNVRIEHPADGQPVDAIHIGLEHQDGYCADVFFPYRRIEGRLELAEPFATQREGLVFDACRLE